MRAYFSYFKLKFIAGLQYRTSALAGICTQFFFGFVYIMIYKAFYDTGSGKLPMELNQLITYVWLNQAFFALVYQFYKDQELFTLIRTGNISYELSRPKNIYFLWYFKILGQRLANVTLRFLPLFIVTIFLPSPYNFSLPSSIENFIFFIITLFFGTLLISSLSVLYPIITLATLNEKGVTSIIIVIADLLSGVGIPLVFFPDFLRKISSLLPFQYVSDLPFRIYVGNINGVDCITQIIIQVVWIIILIIIGQLIMKKNIKRLEIQGG